MDWTFILSERLLRTTRWLATPELIAHQEWLGYLQPVGLVVSPPALAAAGAYPNKNIIPDHARFLECVEPVTAGR